MTDQPPVQPTGMPNFERPPTPAETAAAHAVQPPHGAPSGHRPSPRSSAPTNPIARRPWVAAAGAAGAIVVAAAAGYGYGRQAEPASTSGTDGSSVAVSTGGDQQQVDPGSGQDTSSGQGGFQLPGSGSDQGQLPGSSSGADRGNSGDPSGGFGAQPGTVSPGQGQGGPTTQSAGS